MNESKIHSNCPVLHFFSFCFSHPNIYEIMNESFPVKTLLGNKSLSIFISKWFHLPLINASKYLLKLVRQTQEKSGLDTTINLLFFCSYFQLPCAVVTLLFDTCYHLCFCYQQCFAQIQQHMWSILSFFFFLSISMA